MGILQLGNLKFEIFSNIVHVRLEGFSRNEVRTVTDDISIVLHIHILWMNLTIPYVVCKMIESLPVVEYFCSNYINKYAIVPNSCRIGCFYRNYKLVTGH